ncbi:MAG: DNA mismatch repair endonuclease MutL [Akkermansia sp.]
MSETLASQVAAGEVVERPASVIKELVENSLDAGAHTISVEIQRGGIALIKVTDDGCGMSKEDVTSSVLRHATSKLLTQEDLFCITQLGFRGEALPSIASVSRLKIGTREHNALEGWEILIEGGKFLEPRTSGISPGTSIEVGELFYNTPARRQFLKSKETETAYIEHQLHLHALSFPNIRFIFKKDGASIFDLPATSDLRTRIAILTDRRTAQMLIPIETTYGPGITITGYLLPPSEGRRNKKSQFTFLNHRPIDDLLVSRAIRDGYGGFTAGLHPSIYLFLEVDPGLVDVNVHPSKKEVRFRRPSDIVSTIIEAISNTLTERTRQNFPESNPLALTPVEIIAPSIPTKIPDEITTSPQKNQKSQEHKEHITPNQTRTPLPLPLPLSPLVKPIPLPATQPTLHATLDAPATRRQGNNNGFHFIGILQNNYALFENKEGLALLHPKAARERIIFEQLMTAEHSGMPSQMLLAPFIIELDPRDFTLVEEMIPYFDHAGISISPFGQKTMRVESLPTLIKSSDAKRFILDIIDRMTSPDQRKKAGKIAYETFATGIAQKASFSGIASPEESQELLNQLLSCEVPYCTPTGTPTLIMYSIPEINRKFGLSR